MSLNNVCFEQIKNNFWYGQFGEFKLVIDKNTGFFNATKLCQLGDKQYNHWFTNKRTKELIEELNSHLGGDLIYEIKKGNKSKYSKQISGTYLHEKYLDDLIRWIKSNPKKDKKGLLYVVTTNNLEKNNIFKVGYTKNIDRRLEQFNSYRLPFIDELYKVIKTYEFEDCYNVEQLVHNKLSKYKIHNKEFFQCELNVIIDAISEID